MKASRGDYSIAFWVKPLGEASLLPDQRFTPHLGFASTLSPPEHQISIAQFTASLSGSLPASQGTLLARLFRLVLTLSCCATRPRRGPEPDRVSE